MKSKRSELVAAGLIGAGVAILFENDGKIQDSKLAEVCKSMVGTILGDLEKKLGNESTTK